MTLDPRRWSLGARMVALFSGLLAAIGVFMVSFFPARMARQARSSAIERAVSIAQVMSTATAPALEFDDADYATTVLGWLATTPDARFGTIERADHMRFAAWHAERIPAGLRRPDAEHAGGVHVQFAHHLLVVQTPITGRTGGRGTLRVGFSLTDLEAARSEAERSVALASAMVVVAGVFATMGVAALVVRPIRRLTLTARRISRGELPPELPTVPGNDEVAQMADALRAMLERVNEVSQQELLRASRHAGMAEVATGVLHNVGNVLTSVNVGVELLRERLAAQPLDRLRQLHELLDTAGTAGTLDVERIAAATRYVGIVTDKLEAGRDQTLRDIAALGTHIEHIKRVVAMQNSYARRGGVVEATRIASLIDEAIEMSCPPALRAGIELGVQTTEQTVAIDRHRVLQIVVNLIANARDAVASATGPRRIAVHGEIAADVLTISVADSGIGVATEARAHIFSAGFTTKADGHGYGLHSSALAARQLGGSLTVASEGIGRGATFLLTVPVGRAEPSDAA